MEKGKSFTLQEILLQKRKNNIHLAGNTSKKKEIFSQRNNFTEQGNIFKIAEITLTEKGFFPSESYTHFSQKGNKSLTKVDFFSPLSKNIFT